MNSEELSHTVVKGMEEKKAEDIVVMDLRKVKGAVSDFFVVCSGNSEPQIEAIAESVEEEVQKASAEIPWRKEGFAYREWILIDYVKVVVHVFKKDRREFYALEELWGDAVITEVSRNA